MKIRLFWIDCIDKETGEVTFLSRFGGRTKNREEALAYSVEEAYEIEENWEEQNTDNIISMYDYQLKSADFDGIAGEGFWLEPKFDGRKSFYKKARVEKAHTGSYLVSYDSKVAQISDGKVFVFGLWDYSPTTLRHVKEYLKQNGFKAESKKQMERDYR